MLPVDHLLPFCSLSLFERFQNSIFCFGLNRTARNRSRTYIKFRERKTCQVNWRLMTGREGGGKFCTRSSHISLIIMFRIPFWKISVKMVSDYKTCLWNIFNWRAFRSQCLQWMFATIRCQKWFLSSGKLSLQISRIVLLIVVFNLLEMKESATWIIISLITIALYSSLLFNLKNETGELSFPFLLHLPGLMFHLCFLLSNYF